VHDYETIYQVLDDLRGFLPSPSVLVFTFGRQKKQHFSYFFYFRDLKELKQFMVKYNKSFSSQARDGKLDGQEGSGPHYVAHLPSRDMGGHLALVQFLAPPFYEVLRLGKKGTL
jgi:hypothetical protein